MFALRLIYILLFLLSVQEVKAQSRLGIMLGGGVTYYYGEMNDRILTHEKLIRGYGNAGVLYRLGNRFDLWANYMHGTLVGDDALAIKYYNRNRNLSFQSVIDEVSVNIGYRILGDRRNKKRKVIPYFFAGIGGYHFKPKTKLNGEWIDLQSTGTEGQYISEGDYPDPYELYQLSVPAGIGVEIRLSRALGLRVEAANHFLFTDYLDDVSKNYPDSLSLVSTSNGTLAALLSNRLKEGTFPAQGVSRGNPKENDSFVHIGVSLLWTPTKGNQENSSVKRKKKSKKNCPAYH